LFGMVLSIGIVVDDAIVVVENVERHIAEGLTPRNAAIKAMQELFGALIAIILVLASVFLPVAFLGGITGELYKQFAVTIALSVMISGFVALTLSPALCALVLKPGHDSPNKLWKTFNRTFDWAQTRYVSMAGTIIKRSALSILIFLMVIFFAIGLFKTVPGGFLPEEDQGYFITVVQLPDGASISRTQKGSEK
ncbi:MAG: efflux RND transporter permease subunit, partial [Nitrosomonas sp.]|nr:efflux RND transporter permease subunit [Nitrosomonas sp.]